MKNWFKNKKTEDFSCIKDNIIMLMEEDLFCIHQYLDELNIPRVENECKEYSIVGRIKELEKKHLKQISELEKFYLSENVPIVDREKIIDYLDKQFWKHKKYECMPENDRGYEYVPRESLYNILDGLIPMLKNHFKLRRKTK